MESAILCVCVAMDSYKGAWCCFPLRSSFNFLPCRNGNQLFSKFPGTIQPHLQLGVLPLICTADLSIFGKSFQKTHSSATLSSTFLAGHFFSHSCPRGETRRVDPNHSTTKRGTSATHKTFWGGSISNLPSSLFFQKHVCCAVPSLKAW